MPVFARVFGCLPTEANCERVFSAAGNTMTQLRRSRSLGSKILESLVFVGDYFKRHDSIGD